MQTAHHGVAKFRNRIESLHGGGCLIDIEVQGLIGDTLGFVRCSSFLLSA